MSLNLHTSNQLEILADKLADSVCRPLKSPLAPEVIVVQSPGMQQWISLELARRLAVWTNCRYPFPNNFLQEILLLLIPEMPDAAPFDRDVMTWRIMQELPSCLQKKGFESLNAYLETDTGYFRTWQLSRQIAQVFDQYCMYRPQMVLRWEAGSGTGWQADLWRLLTRGKRSGHRAALRKALCAALKDPCNDRTSLLPQRVSVFGISTLPPFHMDVLAAIADHCEVNMFLMNPSQEYWAEIKSDYEIIKALRNEGHLNASVDDLHLETGNSLLASMGKLGRDFLGILLDYNPEMYSWFAAPHGNALLHSVQTDILNMIDRGAVLEKRAPQLQRTAEVMQGDNSIRIHSCHSPMREAEVLHDFLLDVFNHNPEIQPRDILVMTPDIETYAPFIRAVFDTPEEENQRIPYAIADQTVRQQSHVVKTYFSVLELAKSRFSSSRVIDILECPAIQRRFNLLPADMDLILGWVRETRICWGIDAAYRGKLGLPEINHNTWKAGIERLLLGYAMPGRDERLFAGILPYDTVEGSEAPVLGKFLMFVDALFSSIIFSEASLTLGQWQEKLLSILDSLFLPDADSGYDVQIMRTIIGHLGTIEKQSEFTELIGPEAVIAWLEYALREHYTGRSFLTGRVTFCAMLPMRSIPFKIICMIGMNDTAFPRTSTAVSFDLIARHPRLGDRSLRTDDRYLFLEAIISAREKLYISYTGQGIQDNSDVPPSVLVSELLDYIVQGYEVPGRQMQDYLVVKHRLQAFSPRYFEPQGELYSYSPQNCDASRAMLTERREPSPFITHELSQPATVKKTIDVHDLTGFFDNPAKFLLTRSIGLYLGEENAVLEEREPFILTGLDKYQFEQRLCERYIAGCDVTQASRTAAALGVLPHGTPGDGAVQAVMPQLTKFADTVASYMQKERQTPVEVTVACNGFSITGTINDIWPDVLLRYRCAKVKARDRLRIWIQHLVINAAGYDQAPRKSILLGTDYVYEMMPVDDIAQKVLGQLIEIYQKGLRRPVHFYPESSLAYAVSIAKGKSREDGLHAARAVWEASYNAPGEGSDAYYTVCFGGTDTFGQEFEALAQDIYEPLLANQMQVTR